MELLDLGDPPASALVVVAHPDDIDFGMAGTVAALVEAGTDVHYAIATSGEAGPPEELPREEVMALRRREQLAAAEAVGVHDVRFLGLPDGHLEPGLALRREITRVIRQVRPELVIQSSPERQYDRIYASHPDHLAVAEATIAAVYPDARNPHAHVELMGDGLMPHRVEEVWILGLEPLDVFVDISGVLDRKAAALASHASQVGWIEDVAGFLRGWSTETATRLGFPEGTPVEAYRRVVAT